MSKEKRDIWSESGCVACIFDEDHDPKLIAVSGVDCIATRRDRLRDINLVSQSVSDKPNNRKEYIRAITERGREQWKRENKTNKKTFLCKGMFLM